MDFTELIDNGWVEMTSEISVDQIIAELSAFSNIKFRKTTSMLQPQLKSNSYQISLSGSYGYNVFPYHTDGVNYRIPPRFLVLKYTGEIASVACTLLLDSYKMENKSDFNILAQEEVYYVTGGDTNFYSTIKNVTLIPGKSIMRYNQLIMKRQNRKSNMLFEDFLDTCSPYSVTWEPNKVVILDNWRIFHSRQIIPENEIHTRKIERTYLFEQ